MKFSPSKALLAKTDKNLFLLVAWPPLLLLLDDRWVFGYVLAGYIDPWIYFAYFLRLPQYLKQFVGAYYGTRLSWLLPGYISYHVFPPVLAECVLHITLCYAGLISLYLILRETVNRRSALMTALLMGSYVFFLFAMGWDYVDGAGCAYCFLSLLALTFAPKARKAWLWTGAAGIFCGAMLHSQMFLLLFVPSLLVYLLLPNFRFRVASLGLLAFAAGIAAITILFGGANYALGGQFWFFLPSFAVANQLVTHGNPWWSASYAWLRDASWLVLPCMTLILSCWFLLFRRPGRQSPGSRTAFIFQLMFLLNFGIMLVMQFRGQPTLQMLYYASYLMPSLFLALGASLGSVMEVIDAKLFRWLLAGEIAILLMPYVLRAGSGFLDASRILRLEHPLILLGLVVGVIASVLLVFKPVPLRTTAVLLVILSVSILNLEASFFFWRIDKRSAMDAFRVLMESERITKTINPRANIPFWYDELDPGDRARYLSRAISATYFWSYNLLGANFPALAEPASALAPHTKAIVLSNRPDVVQEANRSLHIHGLVARLLEEHTNHEGQISLKISLLELQPLPQRLDVVRFNDQILPTNVNFRWGPMAGKGFSLEGPGVYQLLPPDLDLRNGWAANKYGPSGGLTVSSDCLNPGDVCSTYSSGSIQDHFVSKWLEVPANSDWIFFSIWVRPLDPNQLPKVYLQDGEMAFLSSRDELFERPDGWLLLGNCVKVGRVRRTRLVVMQPPGTASRLEKAFLVALPSHAVKFSQKPD